MQDPNDSFESAVHRHDFTDAGGGAGKMDEGVEDWEEGRCVKSCFVV